MICCTILVTFAALVAQQSSENGPAPKDSRKIAARPSDPLPPVPGKSLPPTSGDSRRSETRPADPLRSPSDLKAGFPITDPKELEEGVARGRAKAEEDLKANKAAILGFGLSAIDLLDRETGLYCSSFGCMGGDEIVGFVQGYNAKVSEDIRDHGLPRNSFKPWEKELFGLADYFENRSRTDSPVRLTVGGPEVRSPDGKFVVKMVRRPSELPSAPGESKPRSVESSYLLVNDQDTEANRIGIITRDPVLVWGPKGSWFAVLKGKSIRPDVTIFEAIDLRGTRPIRREFMEKQGSSSPRSRTE